MNPAAQLHTNNHVVYNNSLKTEHLEQKAKIMKNTEETLDISFILYIF